MNETELKATQMATQVREIANLVREGTPQHTVLDMNRADIAPRLLWRTGTMTDLEGILPKPLRTRATARLKTHWDFVAYVNRHRLPGTLLTGDADEKGGRITALIDYHNPIQIGGEPHWPEHEATLVLEPTPEWTRWMGICNKDLSQQAFAEFLEDNAIDVVVPELPAGVKFPTQQELLSVASTLQIKTDVQFASALKLQNGQIQLGYVEKIDGTHGQEGRLPVPEKFAIAVSPFRGTPKYQAIIRLRYRGSSGKAMFRLEMERPHKIVEAVFTEIRTQVTEATTIPVLLGTASANARPQI